MFEISSGLFKYDKSRRKSIEAGICIIGYRQIADASCLKVQGKEKQDEKEKCLRRDFFAVTHNKKMMVKIRMEMRNKNISFMPVQEEDEDGFDQALEFLDELNKVFDITEVKHKSVSRKIGSEKRIVKIVIPG